MLALIVADTIFCCAAVLFIFRYFPTNVNGSNYWGMEVRMLFTVISTTLRALTKNIVSIVH